MKNLAEFYTLKAKKLLRLWGPPQKMPYIIITMRINTI